GIPFTTAAVGGMFGFFFHPGPVRSMADAKACDVEAFRRFFSAMLDAGVYLAPSPFEAGFVSLAQGRWEIEDTLDAAARAFVRVATRGRRRLRR
ncbi:MAG: aspartate aminotransferase family protein, partial [Myxococcota bacterium]|nr:aspartate aminotransferase family protein [Myxococcota bacterium]